MSDMERDNDVVIFEQVIRKMRFYHPSGDLSMVQKAYELAKSAHEGQFRKSGEPYIIHPLQVAYILAELELDRESVAAGILHDIIEDTDYDYDYIKEHFSEEIANLVDGVTKLEKLHFRNRETDNKTRREEEQASNLRKLFLAMSNDIRVIMIKIADRLHNLRTLQFMPPEKQQRIAQESLDIYAPLAGRMGIASLRREMEDLSFRYSNFESYNLLKEKIQMKLNDRFKYVEEIVAIILKHLEASNIEAKVDGRPKHFFSIWKKMKNSGKNIDQIYDLFAVRIIVDEVSDCYQALGIVHSLYTSIPGRFKDYINNPKSNMYQSIHTSLFGPGSEPFEVQIRTWDMHKTAENGIAAHWKYKEGKRTSQISTESEIAAEQKLSFLREILETQRNIEDNQEYLESVKGELNIYTEYVQCFTPKGKTLVFAKGSTCLDFAYAIHSAVGNRMVGAKVNNKMESRDYILQNGDIIDILTSQNAKGPTIEWLKIAKTNQAKSKIKQWLKKEDKEESVIKGRDMLEKAAKRKALPLATLLANDRNKVILRRFGLRDMEAVYAAVGRGAIKENTIINRLYDEYLVENPKNSEEVLEDINKKLKPPKNTVYGDVIVKGEAGLAIRFSKCCGPVPGDEILGFITRGRGVAIHRTDCINIIKLEESEKKRLIEAEWNSNESNKNSFYVELNIICEKMDMITPVTQMIRGLNLEMRGLTARNSNKGEVILTLGISVASRDEIDKAARRLLALKGIINVDRIAN